MSVWKILAELDFVPGVSMVTPDANYTLGQRNFHSQEEPAEWPYEDDSNGGGPANASDKLGQRAAGRGDGRGRPNVSGKNEPSSAYLKTWQTDESYEDRGKKDRHGAPRNLWSDTPDGEQWTDMNNESFKGSVWDLIEAAGNSPFDDKTNKTAQKVQAAASGFGSLLSAGSGASVVKAPGSTSHDSAIANVGNQLSILADRDQQLAKSGLDKISQGQPISPEERQAMFKLKRTDPQSWKQALQQRQLNNTHLQPYGLREAMGTPTNFTMSNRSGNMMGHNLPGTSRNEPTARKNFIPEEEEMNLKEFFDPNPIPVEGVENDNPDHKKDQSDDDLENKIDRNYGLESNDDFGEPPPSPLDHDDEEGMIAIKGTMDAPGAQEFMSTLASPAGPGGLLPPGGAGGEVVQKSSAWDVLQKVVDALGKNLNDGC